MTSCTKAVQTRINCLSLEHFLISFSHGKVYFCLRINSFYFQLATAIRPWWERPYSSRCFWTQTVVFCTTTSYSLPNASQTRCQKNSKSATSSTQGQISLGINLKTICYSCLKSSFFAVAWQVWGQRPCNSLGSSPHEEERFGCSGPVKKTWHWNVE